MLPSAAVSLTQIEYFVAVAEAGQLTRAAARLHVSQPPLTRQIKSLEEELGTPLFRRTRLGMVLLPAGDTFLTHARRVLLELAEAKRAIRTRSAASSVPSSTRGRGDDSPE